MRLSVQRLCVITAGVWGIALACMSMAAADTTTAGGIVVNFGIVPAELALRAEGHSEAHPVHPPSGSQHLLITLDDAKSGQRIGDAEVAIEVTDPRGHVEKKVLLHTHGGGLPDYSDLFVFGWSGKYAIRVVITPQPGAKPIEARFTVTHVI